MTSRARAIRRPSSASTPLVVGALLIAAALLVGVGQIKHASVVRAVRHTSHVTATVLSVGRDRIANVRYVLGGKPHIGQLNISAAHGVDSGDGLALRVASGGGLQLETPFYATAYPATAAALTVTAAVIIWWSWRSSANRARRSRMRWMPAELSRPHLQPHHRGDGPARRPD